ncbi:hypothetical protein B0A49_08227 [Cryomyces minteri]|uniref:gamma-glutamylcyclotransferase n=1 Tax=Cryomyces minteri TaxID=331657 RepID=A0A4U0WPF3_9PEZI|nr:hypothetical protein B0A49_08227 [Cryomyces minteri]
MVLVLVSFIPAVVALSLSIYVAVGTTTTTLQSAFHVAGTDLTSPSVISPSTSRSTSTSPSALDTDTSTSTVVNDRDSNMTLYFGYGSNLWLHQMARRCPDSTYKGIARLDGHRWIINKRGYANVVSVPSVPSSAAAEPSISPEPAASSRSSKSAAFLEPLAPSKPSSAPPSRRSTRPQNTSGNINTASNDLHNGVPNGYEKVDGGAEESSVEAEDKDVVYGLIYTLTPSDERRLDINEGVPESYTKHSVHVTFWPSTNASASSPRSLPARVHASTDTGTAITALVYVDLHRIAPSEPRAEYVYRMNRGIDDALALGLPEKWINKVLRPYIPADGEGEADGIDGAGNGHGPKAGVDVGDGEGTATGNGTGKGNGKGRGTGENAGTADMTAVREKAMQQAGEFLSDRE